MKPLLAWIPPPVGRLLLVVAGIVVGQAILYGPSLVGARILLPIDLLDQAHIYLPQPDPLWRSTPHDIIVSDMVYDSEMNRWFALQELRAGRLPLWCPNRYAGAPCFRWSLSPTILLGYFIASPVVLAWNQLLIALTAGVGAYVFCRTVLQVGFWPAVVTAWCLPLTGTYIAWQGMGPPPVICWLPWLLLAVDRTIRRPWGWAGPLLAVVTFLVVVSGQTDMAGQMLLLSGCYALWLYFDHYRGSWAAPRSAGSLVAVTLGWALGMLAGSVLLLPLVEYTRSGARFERRSQGKEERPPVGLSALPQAVLPEIYGLTQRGSIYLGESNVPESAVSGYAGLLAALLAAPLAWCSSRHRSINGFWVFALVFSLAWTLNLPVLVSLLRLPGLNMMSHNRFVFATAFAVLALAAVGLDALGRGAVPRSRWTLLPMGLLLVLGGWCLYRLLSLPEPVATVLEKHVNAGRTLGNIGSMADVARVRERFRTCYAIGLLLCFCGLFGWLRLRSWDQVPRWLVPGLGAIMVAELLWFGYGVNAQCDPALYYPRLPALEKVKAAEPGRMLGVGCLPANLAQSHDLRDLRGYDGVDPARLIDLMVLAVNPQSPTFDYARVQWFIPQMQQTDDGEVILPPVLDMLNVRYLVFWGEPPPMFTPDFQAPDYWVVKNRRALPRVLVPQSVRVVPSIRQRLALLGQEDFDARKTAFVELPLDLPDRCDGSATITRETPQEIDITVQMNTPGLVVLADLWDRGWKADLDGKPVAILPTNHAVRGVVVPAGETTLQFRYQPDSLRLGLKLAGLAGCLWLLWVGAVLLFRRKGSQDSAPVTAAAPAGSP